MGTPRRVLLSVLPKWLLSRSTGLLTRIPLPRSLRTPLYGWFCRRYGVEQAEMAGQLADYRSFAAFFQRALLDGRRPIADGCHYVWPCDGKVITAGPLQGDRIDQVKGRSYRLDQLLQDRELAESLSGGHQATIYLAPGDYHRVHAPFDAEIRRITHIPGKLFPVNPGAVDSIPDLFPRNERVVFSCRLRDGGHAAAVVMVSALNVGDTKVVVQPGMIGRGAEIGWFGFGSTVIVVVGADAAPIAALARETVVRVGAGIKSR